MFISKKWLWTNNYEWPKSQEQADIYGHNVLQNNIYMGYFFPLKENVSKNMPLSVFTLIKEAQLHVWV